MGAGEGLTRRPSAVIKQRMQIKGSGKLYRSMFDCAKYVYRNEGLAAFYVSYPTTLSMTVPFTALQFLAYESISTTMNPSKKYDPLTHCLAGAVAGGFAAALTTPMDVIKTMLQTRGNAQDAELRTVNSFVAGCRLLYQREGFRGFFKGVRPRVVTTMPSTAICWSAYEASKYVDSDPPPHVAPRPPANSLSELISSSKTTHHDDETSVGRLLPQPSCPNKPSSQPGYPVPGCQTIRPWIMAQAEEQPSPPQNMAQAGEQPPPKKQNSGSGRHCCI